MYIKVNDGQKSAILNFDQGKKFQDISFPETTHLVYNNGLVIWHNFPKIMHIEVSKGPSQPFCN